MEEKKNSPSTTSERTVIQKAASPETVRAELVEAMSLSPHPTTQPVANISISASIMRGAGSFDITYTLSGAIEDVVFSVVADPIRTDELWKTTCFEAFARAKSDDSYIEYNFAPSTKWAAYSFTAYREGMADLAISAPPIIQRNDADGRITFTVSAEIPVEWGTQGLLLNLTAVIEEMDGTKSYWALKHPDGPPDFHDPACIILSLKAPDPA